VNKLRKRIAILIFITVSIISWADLGEILLPAAKNGRTDIIKILIIDGININYCDSRGWTALMYAVQENDLNTARFLLFYGADPEIKNNAGNTAVMIATFNNNTELIDLLSGDFTSGFGLMGVWKVDLDSLLETPQIKEQLEAMPEMKEMFVSAFSDFTFEFTPDEIIMSVMGEIETRSYTIINTTEYSMELEVEEDTSTINIIDTNRIEMDVEGQLYVLIKQISY
jgi:hypothetical protein